MATKLRLDGMDQRHRALTPAVANNYREAADVCLSRHHHPPVQITLSDNGAESVAELTWVVPDARIQDAWANTRNTTEAGAYCCVIAAVEELRGFVAVRQAETGTGADYYVGLSGAGQHDLEDCFRLEVSGVDAGDHREVTRRLLEKVQQAAGGDSSLPALAGVVGFSARLLMLRDVAEVA